MPAALHFVQDRACTVGGDRTDLGLPQEEQALLELVRTADKPLVVALMCGGPISSPWIEAHADALLQCWYPGEEGGRAIAEVLAGTCSPAGRLPVTLYRCVDQLPSFTDYSMRERTYRYFSGTPLYPFGFGLSYASFGYSELQAPAMLAAGEALLFSVVVTNTSAHDSDEVVQAYIDYPDLPGAPRRALVAFERIHLRAGECRQLAFSVDPQRLSHVRIDGQRCIGPGDYRLSVGGGQPDGMSPCVGRRFSLSGWQTLSSRVSAAPP